MRHKWLIALMFGWSCLTFEHAMQTWLVEGSSGYNYYYFVGLIGSMAQIGAITTALGVALHLTEVADKSMIRHIEAADTSVLRNDKAM